MKELLTANTPYAWPHLAFALPAIALAADVDFKLGKTKIFVKDPLTLFELEKARAVALPALIARMQRRWRAAAGRTVFRRQKAATVKLETFSRGRLARCSYARARGQLIVLAALMRGFVGRRRTKATRVQFKNKPPRYWANQLQRRFRGYKAVCALDAATRERCAQASDMCGFHMPVQWVASCLRWAAGEKM